MVTVIQSYSHSQGHSQSHDQCHGHFVGLGDGHRHIHDMLFTTFMMFMMVSYVQIPYVDERMSYL